MGRPRKYHTDEERAEARREYQRRWRARNPEAAREYRRRWREKNPEKVRDHNQRWQENHPEYARKWREENPEQMKEHLRRWNEANRARRKFHCKKGSARRDDIEFTITFEEIEFPDVCPALGIELDYAVEGTQADNSPSFDRIDPSKGYVPGNVQILSQLANRIKTNATAEQVALVAAFMAREKQ